MPYIGNTIRAADDYRLIDDISSSFNGSTTSFALQVAGSTPVPFPKSPQQVLISVNGVIQEPDPTGVSGFNLVGTNIVFSSAPTNGHAFFGIIYATADYLNAGGNFPSGSTGAPSLTFIGDEDTGIYRKGSGSVAFVSNSTEIANTDSNGITISSGGLILGDSSGSSSNRIKLGASGDLEIYHNGTESIIHDTGTGNLKLRTDSFRLRNAADTEHIIKAVEDGAVEIYFNTVKKFETTSGGIAITGGLTTSGASTFNEDVTFDGATAGRDIVFDRSANKLIFKDDVVAQFGDSSNILLYHDSSADTSYIQDNSTGDLFIQSNSSVRIKSADEDAIRCVANAGVKLYFNDNLKFETTTNGASITGKLDLSDNLDMPDNAKVVLGTGDDLKIYSDGSTVFYAGDDQRFRNKALDENFLTFAANGSVTAFYDGSNKFQTTSSGVTVTGNIAVTGVVDGVDIAALSSSVSGKLSNVVDDTTPQLGGNLDCNNKTLTMNDSSGDDNNRIKLGNGGDLKIFHDGNSKIHGTSGYTQLSAQNGSVYFDGNSIFLRSGAGNEHYIKCIDDGQIELYYDNSKKLETKSNGVEINGHLSLADNNEIRLGNVGSNGDTRITHVAGSHTEINHVGTGDLILETVNGGDDILLDSNDDIFLNHAGESMIVCRSDAEVELYYDNTKRFSTNSSGAKVHGNSGNIFEATCSTNSTANILFQNTEANTLGDMRILIKTATNQGSDPYIKFDAGGNDMIVGTLYAGGANNKLVLGHGTSPSGGVIGLHIDGNGQITPDSNNARDLGSNSLRFRNIYTNDLNLSNEGSPNDVDSTWGNYTIQEGHEDLFLINNRTGKKFKFNLTEVA